MKFNIESELIKIEKKMNKDICKEDQQQMEFPSYLDDIEYYISVQSQDPFTGAIESTFSRLFGLDHSGTQQGNNNSPFNKSRPSFSSSSSFIKGASRSKETSLAISNNNIINANAIKRKIHFERKLKHSWKEFIVTIYEEIVVSGVTSWNESAQFNWNVDNHGSDQYTVVMSSRTPSQGYGPFSSIAKRSNSDQVTGPGGPGPGSGLSSDSYIWGTFVFQPNYVDGYIVGYDTSISADITNKLFDLDPTQQGWLHLLGVNEVKLAFENVSQDKINTLFPQIHAAGYTFLSMPTFFHIYTENMSNGSHVMENNGSLQKMVVTTTEQDFTKEEKSDYTNPTGLTPISISSVDSRGSPKRVSHTNTGTTVRHRAEDVFFLNQMSNRHREHSGGSGYKQI